MIGAEPSKETPLMLRAVASLLAVQEFPVMLPKIVERKDQIPLVVLASASMVELAA